MGGGEDIELSLESLALPEEDVDAGQSEDVRESHDVSIMILLGKVTSLALVLAVERPSDANSISE